MISLCLLLKKSKRNETKIININDGKLNKIGSKLKKALADAIETGINNFKEQRDIVQRKIDVVLKDEKILREKKETFKSLFEELPGTEKYLSLEKHYLGVYEDFKKLDQYKLINKQKPVICRYYNLLEEASVRNGEKYCSDIIMKAVIESI